MLVAAQMVKAATPDTTIHKAEVGVGLSPGPTGVTVTFDKSPAFQGERVQTGIGWLIEAKDHLLNNLVALKRVAGAGTLIETSVGKDGIRRLDGNSAFRVQVGPELADMSKSHVIDAMFKVCIAKLLETAKTGAEAPAP